MTRRRVGFLLAGLLVATPALWAAYDRVRRAESDRLLRALATAHERTGYAGRATWKRTTKRGWSVRVRHDAESGRTEYGWRRWRTFTTAAPSSRMPDPAAWCLDTDAVIENYRLEEEEGRTEYLGRPARRFRLRARHEGRPSVHLTVDAATLLALEASTYTATGELYRTAAFVQIEIGPQAVKVGRSRRHSSWLGDPVEPDELEETAGFLGMRPDYLPAGFRCTKRRVNGWATPAIRLTYTDGITAFELHQSQVATPAQIETALLKRMSWRRADRELAREAWRRSDAIARSSGDSGVVAHRKRWCGHESYELRVDQLRVKLTSRLDLPEEEVVSVLRSLRAR